MAGREAPDRAEETVDIAAEKAKADALFASIGEAVLAIDERGRIMRVNEIALDLLGYEEHEILGKSYLSIMRAFDLRGKELEPYSRPIFRAIQEGKPITDNIQFCVKNGRRIPVVVTASPIMLGGRPIGTIEVFRDITREQQIDKAKTEFVSIASHQLRTPLTAVRWYVDMLLKGTMGALTDVQQATLQEIHSSSMRMIKLVDALLSVARIEVGTLAIKPEESDIKQLAHDVVAELAPQISDKKLKFIEKYDESIPEMQLDPDLTRIIFQNLLTNAIKYTPEGGSIKLDIKREARKIHILVTDTGYGVPKAQQKLLFTKLFRADNVRQYDTDGTGLGLYIVRSIVEESKGKIWFESTENKGTTFHVSLPVKGMAATLKEPTV